jgi:2OG-Fe(II) oxygenase superfamily
MSNILKEGKYVAPGICVYEDVLSDPQRFIDFALKQNGWRDAEVFSTSSSDTSVKNNFRNNRVLDLNLGLSEPIQWFEIGSLIFSYINKYAKENEFAFGGMEPLGMLHYKSGEGFYKPHVDHHDASPRVAAALLYLNDVEEGGETHFVNFDISVKPKAGTLVLFPGNYPYLHGAKTPISGDKFVVVTWFPPSQTGA